MRTLLNDIKYAFRMLRKKPGFTVIAVLTLALGIGSVTAVLSVMNGTFHRLFPYKNPDRLVLFVTEVQGMDISVTCTSGELFRQWKDQSNSFEDMTAYIPRTGHVIFSGWSDDTNTMKGLIGLRVAPNFFAMLDIKAAMGRTLSPQEDRLEGHPVIILSDHIWRQRFSADPDILGKEIRMEGMPCQVIGVMPPNYRFPPSMASILNNNITPNRLVDYWIPLSEDFHKNDPYNWAFEVVGRMKPDVTVEQAQTEMDAIHKRLMKTHGDAWGENNDTRVTLLPHFVLGRTRPAVIALLVAAAFVLLIACVNVTNLLTVRAMARKREMAIRSSLGCGVWRLIRQLVTENFLLALMGGIGGVLLAYCAIYLLLSFAPTSLPGLNLVRIDRFVLGISLIVTFICGLFVGLIPALRMIRSDPNIVLKESTGRASSSRSERSILGSLVSAEVALTLVLLIGAGLMIRSFWNLMNVELGIRTDKVLSVTLVGPDAMKAQNSLIERFRGLPGVEQAATISSVPLSGFESDQCAVADVTNSGTDRQEWPVASLNTISPDSLSLLGIKLKQGRYFTDGDHKDSKRVIIVDESLVQRLWPGENPIGREMTFDFRNKNFSSGKTEYANRQVIGIVADVKNSGPDSSVSMTAYIPSAQSVRNYFLLGFLIRCTNDPENLVSAVRSVITETSPNCTIMEMETLESRLTDCTADRRFLMMLLISFALSAFCLAVVGLYGVVSHIVSGRTYEIAVRMALGARSKDVQTAILIQSLKMLVFGIGTGLVLAWLFRSLIAAQLFGVASMDFISIIGSSIILVTVALLACLIPARRAAKTDPMEALRYE